MRRIIFEGDALEQFMYWVNGDKKIATKIHTLLKDIDRNGAAKGFGKPERLRYGDGWSRRITEEHRLVYEVDDKNIYVHNCKGHYK